MHCDKSKIWGYLTIVGAALFHLSLGYNYTIGNMNPYLISYMNITAGETVWFHAVVISGQALSMPLGGYLESKIGFRPVVAIGGIMCSGGVALSSLTVNHGIGPFIVTYAVMFGLGMGLPYSVLFTIAAAWFPKHRAVVVGIILGGLGMGALVFTPTQTALINPDNLDTSDERVRSRIPTSFLILAALMFALQLIGFFLCRKYKPPAEEEEKAEEESSELEISVDQTLATDVYKPDHKIEHVQITYDYTITEALRSIDFYLIAFLVFINTVPITLQASSYKVFGKQNHLDDRFLSTVATCTSIFNCSGRVIWGLICDKISFKFPLGWMLVQWALLFGTFPAIATTSAFRALFAIWVFLLFFTMAGHFVLLPGACSRIFGPKYMATTYGLLYFTTAPSALILAAIVSQFDIAQNFDLVFYCCCGLCCLGFLISIFLKDTQSKLGRSTRICADMCNVCRSIPKSAIEAEKEDFEDSNIYDETFDL
uniref:MFS domain-containing protein n=1 Tax=Mesocestoides corti TaxID=53468 RepID=A0A5K3EW76_MESCO